MRTRTKRKASANPLRPAPILVLDFVVLRLFTSPKLVKTFPYSVASKILLLLKVDLMRFNVQLTD